MTHMMTPPLRWATGFGSARHIDDLPVTGF
jgi:hypothetical protein